jgi:hypothetical protein
MLKEPSPQQYQIKTIPLDQLVPEDHLVRKNDAAIDFEFIRDAVAHLYCPYNGRPAIDPICLIKVMLLGYLFGVPSARRLVKEIQTIQTIGQALNGSMANGCVLYTDSTHLKADANPRKAVNELRPEGVSEYFTQLNDAVEADRKQREKNRCPPQEKSPKMTRLKTPKSAPPPRKAAFMYRDNKPKGFFNLDHRTVDDKHGIILDTHVTLDNVHGSQPFIGRLARQVERFSRDTVTVGVDAGYFTSAVCHLTEDGAVGASLSSLYVA